MNEYEIIQHPQIDGITLFFDTLSYRTPHFHEDWELVWVVEGELEIRCGGRQCTAQKGEIAVLGPLQPHELQAVRQECTFLCLQVSPQLLERLFPAAGRTVLEGLFLREYLTPEEYGRFRQNLRQTARAYLEQPDFYQLYCGGQICLLWHMLFVHMPCRVLSTEEGTQAKKRNARLARLLKFVDQNYMQKIRLSDFAKAEGCTINHMSFFVHQCLGQSFQQYVDTVRFHCACKLIDAGSIRMTDVCFQAGFSDYRYFCKAFRQRLGITPEEYSRHAQRPVQQPHMQHSIYSKERFYSREKSRMLLNKLEL